MNLTRRTLGVSAGALAASACVSASGAPAPAGRSGWRGAWGTSLQGVPDAESLPAGTRVGRTISPTLSGSALRLRLTNEYGASGLAISGVTVGGRSAVTFSGASAFLIPAGAVAISDPIEMAVTAGAALEVSLTLTAATPATNIERTSDRKGGWIAGPDGAKRDAQAMIFSTLDVRTAKAAPVLVIVGDTKSAGVETWPTFFAGMAKDKMGVVNRSVFAGLLALGAPNNSNLARFDREVLPTSGATHALIFSGNNDLIQPGMIGGNGRMTLDPALAQSPEQLIALLEQAVRRTRDAGLKAVGGTWLPYEGVTQAQGYSTPEKLAKRNAVNAWIRKPGSFDLIVDFDAALRDPAHPQQLLAAYDSGNHFTPNEAGYRKMAEAAAAALLR